MPMEGDRIMTYLSSNRLPVPTLLMGFATLWGAPGFASALELGEGFDLADH